MLMQAKKKWLGVCVVSLGMTVSQVNAGGLPVIDGAAIAQMVKDAIVTANHYSAVISNWKSNLQNMMRGQLTQLTGYNFNIKSLSDEEINRLLNKKKEDCNKIANMQSRQFCKEMIILNEVKIKSLQSGEKNVQEEWNKYLQEVNRYNELQSIGGNNTESLKTIVDNINTILKNIDNMMKQTDLEMKTIDARIELLRKARVQIAQEQMKGTSLTSSMTKGAIVEHIREKTELIKYNEKNENNIQTLREKNNKKSNDAWNSYQKFPK